MGWCSGTEIAEPWFAALKRAYTGLKLEAETFLMIDKLREQDWDCEDDMEDPLFKHIYAKYRNRNGEEDEE